MNIMLKKDQWAIFGALILAFIVFIPLFLIRGNYEFMIYIGVIVFFMILVVYSNDKIKYPNLLLWALTIWAILHMAGGGLYINGEKLYELMLINLVGAPYHIFKYDQLMHIYGFFTATLAMYYLIKPSLKKNFNKWISLSIVVIFAGVGLGALNEIIEFSATVFLNETGVGGYVNTCLDLVSNLIGAVIGMGLIIWKEKK